MNTTHTHNEQTEIEEIKKLKTYSEIIEAIEDTWQTFELPEKDNMEMSELSDIEKLRCMIAYNSASNGCIGRCEIPFRDELLDLDPSGDIRRELFSENLYDEKHEYVIELCYLKQRIYAFENPWQLLFAES